MYSYRSERRTHIYLIFQQVFNVTSLCALYDELFSHQFQREDNLYTTQVLASHVIQVHLLVCFD